MTASLLDGKLVSGEVNKQTAQEVEGLKKNGITPGLSVVIVGDDPASKVYVGMKEKRAAELNIHSVKHHLPVETTQEELLALIDQLNNDKTIHGILVQSPPPPQIDEGAVVLRIDPAKDVDCFHPYNVGKMLLGDTDGFVPCTPAGVMQILKHYNVETEGKHAVVIGRSNIVGKPMTALLMQKAEGANATVTVCHSRTKDIQSFAAQADILVAAIGKPKFVTGDMVKEGAVVIDVGVNRVDDPTAKKGYRLVGDVDFDAAVQKASQITPVPGGVGPMTIAMLMSNCVKACKQQNAML